VGNTPSTLRLKPGEHEIMIRMSGYTSWQRKMKVAPGSHPSVMASLQKK
jgi:PEGA domain